MKGIRVIGLKKSFGANTVLESLSFEVEEGQFCILLGPSGCGKSTVLRLIAGLEREDGGDIYIGEMRVNELPPRDRDIAMVFQSYALYPHLNVYENLAFPLKMRKIAGVDIEQKVREAAHLLGLDGLLMRRPGELSGGQRQRVAMGRALVRSPKLFLFDEPLSNLDARLRASMRVELAGLHKKLGVTMLYVTHDQVEAMTLGEKIILLDKGIIQQEGTPRELYEKPRNVFVASFIGSPQINLIEGEARSEAGRVSFTCGAFSLEIPRETGLKAYQGMELTLGIRPECLSPGEGPIRGVMEIVENIGPEAIVYLKTRDGSRLAARAPADFRGQVGDSISLRVDMQGLLFFHQGERVAP